MNLNSSLMISDSDARKLREMLEGAAASRESDRINWLTLEEEIGKAYQIAYPHEANYAQSKISILAPIGTALLGYPACTEIEWNRLGVAG